jgi:hypothetical protein
LVVDELDPLWGQSKKKIEPTVTVLDVFDTSAVILIERRTLSI